MNRTARIEEFGAPGNDFLILVESACDWAFFTDEGFRIIFAHKCETAICNILPENLINQPLETFLPFAARTSVMQALSRAGEQKKKVVETVYTDPLTGLYQIRAQQNERGIHKGFCITVKRITPEALGYIRQELYGDSYRTIDQHASLQLEQQRLIAKLSSEFAKNTDNTPDNIFSYAIRELGSFMGVDRCSIFRHDLEQKTYSVIYEWHAPGVSSTKGILQNIPYNDDDEGFIQLTTRPYIAVDDTFQYSDEAYRIQRESGVHAFADIPILCNGKFWGFLGADYGGGPHYWTDSEFHMLQTISSVISATIEKNEALERAKQANLAKGDFLSQMSHEIRTPMNAIIGMTELAKSSNDPERVLYCLDKVNEAAEHLLGVINDILDMSKIDAGKLELSIEDFPLEKVLRRVSSVTYFRADQKKQEFLIKVDRDVPEAIVTDSQRLAQVLTNLLSNAVKFTPDGGKIVVYVHNEGESQGLVTLRFEVVDTGIGISPKAKEKLFKSFSQADSTISRRFGGTGLGLAISKNIVELMQGEITVDSVEGEGSIFSFTITVPVGKNKSDNRLGEGVDWERVRIMVVDDAPEVLEYFQDITNSFGLTCTTATSGAEAIAHLENNGTYQLLFVDWKMPEMDGVELTKRIRAQFGENIVIIMISAAEWEEIKEEAQAAGVSNFMSKPLLPSMIIDHLNNTLSQDKSLSKPAGPNRNKGIFTGKRVLVAEDVDINREIFKAMLQNTGVAIDFAHDGRQAVELFGKQGHLYDMILMDIHMPELDGYEATKEIRRAAHEEAASIPIVAMTANVFKEDVERCLSCGMDDHLGKPIDLDEMIQKMRKYLHV